MITSAIKLGARNGSRRYGLTGRFGRSRIHRSDQLQAGLLQKLPRTLVAFPVLLLLVRITLFAKGHVDTAFGYIDSYAMVEIGLVGTTILLLLLDAATGPVLRTVVRAPVGWLLFYYIFATLSAAWSLMPSYTFFRGIEVLVQFLGVFVILAHARSFAAREFTFLAAGAMAIVLEIAGLSRIVGGIDSIADMHTNTYSNVGLMLFVYCLAEHPGCEPSRRRTLFWFGLFGLAAIVVGTSATTNLAAVVGILLAVIISVRRSGLQPITVVAICVLLFLVLLALLARDSAIAWLMPDKSLEEIQTFTGRRNLWEDLSGLVHESPLLGRGFVASTRAGDLKLASAHNVLMQVMMDTGLLGAGLLTLALIALGVSCIRPLNHRSPGSAGFAAAFVALAPVNVTIPVWGAGWERVVLAWAFLVGLHTFSSRQQNPGPPPSKRHSLTGSHGGWFRWRFGSRFGRLGSGLR
jgi:O-Antigen ligase